MVQWGMPAGKPREKTQEVQLEVEKYFLTHEKNNVRGIFTIAGGGFGAAGQNTGQGFVKLTDWEQRKDPGDSAQALVERASTAFRGLRDAQVFAPVPGAIRGRGPSSGFTMGRKNSNGL